MARVGRTAIAAALLGAVVSVGAAAAQPGPASTYVVVLTSGSMDVRSTASALARANGGTVGFVYEHALRGFSIRVSAAGAAAIARNPSVAYVEADQVFATAAQSLPTGIARIYADENASIGIDGVDDLRVDVDVAVIDTGIDLDHPDLNVVGGTNCVNIRARCGTSPGNDGNGHGTHVAGTIGALDNDIGVPGVAPGARLWAVRVLGDNGTGTTSQIIAGMDWVTARASTIEVANMSLTGGASQSVDDAANRMADAGVAVAVAAGNSNADAASYSPARAAKVLTVSAIADYDGEPGGLGSPPSTFCSDVDDTDWDPSNWGATIEIAAPGCRILSTYLNGGYAWINGTSMASPHAAGALALLASKGFTRNYPDGVQPLYDTLESTGNFEWTDESGDGVQEPLLDVRASAFAPRMVAGPGGGDPPPPPDNQAPTASFASSCNELACSFDGSGSTDADGSIASYAWSFGDGSTGSGAAAPHTYAAGGTYTVTLIVTDDDGATGSSSQSVTVSDSSAGTTVSLDGSSTASGSTWAASVTVSTNDGSAVTWSWSSGTTGSGTCSTTPCTATKSGIPKRTGSVTLTATAVSNGATASVTVAKP